MGCQNPAQNGRAVARPRRPGQNAGVSGPVAPVVDELPLAVLVEGFEAATLPLARFHHREHMRVALWYLSREPEIDATARMRGGLARFLAHHGRQGYHETLTVFWMKRLAARFAVTDPARPLDERIEVVIVSCLSDTRISDYYTAETLASAQAKRTWVPPDCRAIDF
jgi:hypothetical protein